jgi:hypothetical protein
MCHSQQISRRRCINKNPLSIQEADFFVFQELINLLGRSIIAD